MLPRADIITIHPVARAAPAPALEAAGDARQEAFQRSLATLVGKSLQGEVLSRLTDGSFIVRVAGAAARMHLPAGVQVGSEVPLTLVSLNPRPTFQFGSSQSEPHAAAPSAPLVYAEAARMPAQAPAPPLPQAAQAAPANAAAPTAAPAAPQGAAPGPAASDGPVRAISHGAVLLGRAPLTPADQLPPIDPKSTPATFSDAAKSIADVLSTALKTPNQPRAIIATAPLAPAPTTDAAQLAGALKSALGKSGLFYESHVAEWSDGKRDIADLMREPQMQRARDSHGADAAPRQPLSDPATAQLINLQLNTQEQGRVAWQGQLWPGQDLQWEISKDAPEGGRGDGGEPPEAAWRSGLRLRFPLLGEIDAQLVMTGEHLHIQLRAGAGEAGALLRGHAAALGAAMEAAGIALSSLDIGARKEQQSD